MNRKEEKEGKRERKTGSGNGKRVGRGEGKRRRDGKRGEEGKRNHSCRHISDL